MKQCDDCDEWYCDDDVILTHYGYQLCIGCNEMNEAFEGCEEDNLMRDEGI